MLARQQVAETLLQKQPPSIEIPRDTQLEVTLKPWHIQPTLSKTLLALNMSQCLEM